MKKILLSLVSPLLLFYSLQAQHMNLEKAKKILSTATTIEAVKENQNFKDIHLAATCVQQFINDPEALEQLFNESKTAGKFYILAITYNKYRNKIIYTDQASEHISEEEWLKINPEQIKEEDPPIKKYLIQFYQALEKSKNENLTINFNSIDHQDSAFLLFRTLLQKQKEADKSSTFMWEQRITVCLFDDFFIQGKSVYHIRCEKIGEGETSRPKRVELTAYMYSTKGYRPMIGDGIVNDDNFIWGGKTYLWHSEEQDFIEKWEGALVKIEADLSFYLCKKGEQCLQSGMIPWWHNVKIVEVIISKE